MLSCTNKQTLGFSLLHDMSDHLRPSFKTLLISSTLRRHMDGNGVHICQQVTDENVIFNSELIRIN